MHGMSDVVSIVNRLNPSVVNVQWVPYLWSRRGVNFSVPMIASRLRRSGVRIVTTVHEAYVNFDTPSRLLTGWPQRLQFAGLVLSSDRLIATTMSQWPGNRPVGRSS